MERRSDRDVLESSLEVLGAETNIDESEPSGGEPVRTEARLDQAFDASLVGAVLAPDFAFMLKAGIALRALVRNCRVDDVELPEMPGDASAFRRRPDTFVLPDGVSDSDDDDRDKVPDCLGSVTAPFGMLPLRPLPFEARSGDAVFSARPLFGSTALRVSGTPTRFSVLVRLVICSLLDSMVLIRSDIQIRSSVTDGEHLFFDRPIIDISGESETTTDHRVRLSEARAWMRKAYLASEAGMFSGRHANTRISCNIGAVSNAYRESVP